MAKTEQAGSPRTLSVDIGGSGVKALVLDERGKPLTTRARVKTPKPATPKAVLDVIVGLAKAKGTFDRASVGFPGVVRNGVTVTAPNLDGAWQGHKLASALSRLLRKPVRVANDADVQGFGAIAGKGVELVITLGTGMGSALFVDGRLVPNLELGHHPFRRGKTYEDQLGNAALKKVGPAKWNKRLARAIKTLGRVFNYDRLYIGGGNTKHITIPLPADVTIVPNEAGLYGGIALWK
ncbi:MAG: ROK family protein [Nitrospirota bacterium]